MREGWREKRKGLKTGKRGGENREKK